MNAVSPGFAFVEKLPANLPPLPPTPLHAAVVNSTSSEVAGNPPSSRRTKTPRGRRFYLIPWWVALLFTLGCVLFVVSSCLGYGKLSNQMYAAMLHTNLAGSSCFLLGGIMGVIETLTKKSEPDVSDSESEDVETAERPRLKKKKGPPKPTSLDIWISVSSFVGTVFFEIPAVTIYYIDSGKWFEKLFYINLHTFLGVICFNCFSLLSFYKFYDYPFVFRPAELPYYPPFLFVLGGFPFIVYSALATLDTYYQSAAVSMSLIGSLFYLGGSVAMQVEIILANDDGR
jgi:hypothetical protein